MQKLSPRIRLRALRKRAGLTYLQLAERLGCCGDMVRRWEALNPSWQSVPGGRFGVEIQRWSSEQGDEIAPADWHPSEGNR